MTSAIILYLVLAPAGLANLDSVQVFINENPTIGCWLR
jgi:hypothetical protein